MLDSPNIDELWEKLDKELVHAISTRESNFEVIFLLKPRSLHYIALHFISVKVHLMDGLRVHSNVLIGIVVLAIYLVRLDGEDTDDGFGDVYVS